MKLRINAKLRAALIAVISTVGFTLTQAQAATQYSTPTYGGAEYVWHGDHWEYPEGTTVNNISRVNNKGGVMVIDNAGTVTNPVGVSDTSDYGGVKVTGATNFTTNLGDWAGSIIVGADAVLNASYGVSIKNTEAATAANVYVEGTLNITGRSNLNLNDGNNYQNWYIGEDGFINLSGITGVNKGSRAWNFQLSVDPGEPVSLDGYTNRTLGGQLTKKFMSTGADLYGQVASFAVFCDGVEMDSSKYTINHDASGMSVTFDAATAIKKMSLTWAGGEAAWEVKGTNWTDAAGTMTSFASGDDVTFTGSGNKAIVNGAIEAGAITVNGGTTIDTTADGASLTADSLKIGAGGSLTLAGTAAIGGAVSVADANALVIGAGSMLKVAGETAKSLIQGTQVANGGTVEVAGGMSFNSSATSKMGGTLAIAAGQTLTLGTNKDNQVYNLASLDALVLGKGANINTKAKLVTIKNLTVNGTTINQQDTLDANTVGLDLKGTTTLAGDLTITGDWKYKMNIDALAGSGSLTLTGGQQEHRAVIGSADINSITVTNKMNETWLDGAVKLSGTLALNGGTTYAGENGSLTVAGLTGSAALKLANGITFTGTGNYTYSGTLTSTGGQIVKQGTGSQTIGGTSLFRTIDIQAGTLVLNGSYAIDNITDGDVSESYIGVDGQPHEEGGFYLQSGTKTVYAVAESGANLDLSHAVFTYGGSDVTAQVVEGSFTIPGGEPNYSVLYVNKDTVDYTAHAQYAQGKGATITTVVVKGGATVDLGENSTIANLQYAATGITAGIAGKGSISAFTGTGTLDLKEGAVLTLADQTLGSNQSLVTSGEGTLSMQNLKVNGGGAVATIGSNATLHQITMGSGTVNLNGDITMERFVLSMENSASTMNIGKDANVHVTGTTLSVANNNASFMVSNWNQVNTLNIEGRLIAEAGISARDGKADINVKDGGTLELHQGLLYIKNTAQYTNINVENGGTLLTAGNANDQASQGLHVNLNNGSTLQGYYAEGVDTAAIAQTLTLGGTVTFDVEAGKTLQLNSNIAGEGVSIVKTGEGALVLNGNANVLYNALNVQAGTIALNGTFDLSGISHTPGTIQYYKDPQGSPTDNGFAMYVGSVQLVSNNYSSVSVGEGASLTLDGYSVKYNSETGVASSSELSLDTFFINKNSERVSSIVAIAPEAGVTLADGAKLVVDAELAGAIAVKSGKGLVEIESGKVLQTTTAAIELSGEGTYALAGNTVSLGSVTLGDDWTGTIRLSNINKSDGNTHLDALVHGDSWVEISGIKSGFLPEWSGGHVDVNIKLTNPDAETPAWVWNDGSGSTNYTLTFNGNWAGQGTFRKEADKHQSFTWTGNIAAWTGKFEFASNDKSSDLTFAGRATQVNAEIAKPGTGTLNLIVGDGANVFATEFTKSVTVSSITVKDNASATFNELHITQAITSTGTVTLNQDLEVSGFTQHDGAAGYYDLEGAFTMNGNGYSGKADSYITIVSGGTVAGEITVTQGDTTYNLLNSGNATLAGSGEATIDYTTFYVNADSVDVSTITNPDTKGVEVAGGTLNVDRETALNITVTDEGTITGDKADAKQVGIAEGATAYYTGAVEDSGVKFTPGDEIGAVIISNNGDATKAYSTTDKDLGVAAQKLEMTKQDGDVTVSNAIVVDELVNTTGKVLTLDNQDALMLTDMNITGSTVQLLYTEEQMAPAEGIVVIAGILQGGDATLKADLTLYGGSTLDVDGGGTHALTLGSTLTVDYASSLINLDDATLSALNAMNIGDTLKLIVAADQTTLGYGGESSYDGMWYDQMFNRAGTQGVSLQGDFMVYAQGDAFGLTKVSNVPEPTTGTLSLLALAALAARRRRH